MCKMGTNPTLPILASVTQLKDSPSFISGCFTFIEKIHKFMKCMKTQIKLNSTTKNTLLLSIITQDSKELKNKEWV